MYGPCNTLLTNILFCLYTTCMDHVYSPNKYIILLIYNMCNTLLTNILF